MSNTNSFDLSKDNYKIGDIVTDINANENVKILYGPFNKLYNYYFEVERQNGTVYTVNTRNIKAIKVGDNSCENLQ